MKRIFAVILSAGILAGCSSDSIDDVMQLREQMQTSKGCRFSATVTADYGESLHEFGMDCEATESGDLTFCITSPQTISGITGKINHDGGQLLFDDQILAFPLLADGQLSPISAPWILIRTLRAGYINACTKTDAGTMAIIDDSYDEDALQLDIWLDENCIPVSAEILYDGLRILSLEVTNFMFL